WPWRRRSRSDDWPIAAHVRCRADAQWLRLLDRGDRAVRHRRNSAHDGRRLELPRYWLLYLRSCLIGCWMGISPAGATPASFMSYGIAKRTSKNGHLFGTG